ncbi:RNA recognition motif domain-containing protein [endosymbiont of Ridgeia piscesae]|jgi:RNA recognition motif-containing protein|uniref:RNA recognition motif (A.k.a RRM, RBD, or RNP domain) n=1 Tax=endosymbiont of Ridgeia piscesae TaxID=54398 RepID=A0A0T5YTT1_9GAMM|nr:RNA-binding protein [endosymbiont of Ridgeia piscesae]KRT53948.1 RNA recognition motif(aka RRM, RBD, or RNP domain) [endosymbiont of Ridgeia piscesae]KRT57299.1 RNA recognition motif (a.k.a RRM, RBD, or RNP domain) [endosymbiont of Ridgeia piscesae]
MNIYVGNLSWNTTDDELHELFAPYGAVDSAKVIMDRETGRSRGFGFVEMSDNSAAQSAIDSLNDSQLGGRSLRVNEAKPRTNSGGGGGRGRY